MKTGYTTSARAMTDSLYRRVESLLAELFNESATEIQSRSRTRINAYLNKNVYPDYDIRTQHEMSGSNRFRVDRRSGSSKAISLQVMHPLLFAREYGETVEGAKRFVAPGMAMAIPYERAMRNKYLAPLVQKKIDKAEEAYARADRARTNRIAKGMSGGDRPAMPRDSGVLFFKSVRVGRSPFMGDLADIIKEVTREVGQEMLERRIGREFKKKVSG